MDCKRAVWMNFAIALLLPIVLAGLAALASSTVAAETVKRKGAFGTQFEARLIEKSYTESLAGVSPDVALERVAGFVRTIDGADVQILPTKEVKSKGKMKCKMPWSFGTAIDAEFQFELAVKMIGEKLSVEFSKVLVEPRHPDLPQGVEKFTKACLDPSRDALMKVIAR